MAKSVYTKYPTKTFIIRFTTGSLALTRKMTSCNAGWRVHFHFPLSFTKECNCKQRE